MKKPAFLTHFYLLIFIIAICHFAVAQQSKIDSLNAVLITQKNDTFKVNTLYALSKAYRDIYQTGKGLDFAKEGIELAKKLKFENGMAICLQSAGIAFYSLGQFDSALIQYEKRLEIVEKLKDTLGIAKTYDNISAIYAHFGKIHEAIDLRKKANVIYEKYKAESNLANGYTWLGNFYKELGNYPVALDFYLKSLKFFEAENDLKNIGYPLLNISSVYRYLKQYETAREYGEKAKEAFQKSGNLNGEATTLYRLSLILLDEYKYLETIQYLNEAKSIFVQTHNFYYETIVNQVLGKCFLYIGDMNKASGFYELALEGAEKLGDKMVLAAMHQNIGDEYFAKGDYRQALKNILESKRIYTELKDIRSLKSLASNLVELYAKINRSDSVGFYMKRFEELSDSLYSRETITSIAEMQTKYESEKKEKEIELAAIKMKQQKTRVIFLSVLVFILLASSLLLYLFLQHKHRKNLLIAKANMERDLAQKEETKSKIRNSVSDHLIKEILEKLEQKIENEKCYLNPDLNIKSLAQQIGTNREYLSQIINKTYNKNFNDFINSYRVQESVEILKKIVSGEHEDWTMEIVAEKSGFKYTSTFYPVFKQTMKMSPAAFKKALKTEK